MAVYDSEAGAGSRLKKLVIEVYDVDGTLFPLRILERFCSDYIGGSKWWDRLSLNMRMIFLDACWNAFDLYKRFTGFGRSGDMLDRCAFKMYEYLFWKPERISTELMEGYSKGYAGLIPEKLVYHVKGGAPDGSDRSLYMVTVGVPKTMLRTMLKECGIEKEFGLYANDFITNGTILGFDWSDFNCGKSGKEKMTERLVGEIEKNISGYDIVEISAFGDSESDIGMFEGLEGMSKRHRGKVALRLHTFKHAGELVRCHVTKNNGRILDSLDEYFTV